MVCSLWYYREDGRGEVRERVVAVIQWILTEHYQEGSVNEELLKEMLFWSCRYMYVRTYILWCMILMVYTPASVSVCIHEEECSGMRL